MIVFGSAKVKARGGVGFAAMRRNSRAFERWEGEWWSARERRCSAASDAAAGDRE